MIQHICVIPAFTLAKTRRALILLLVLVAGFFFHIQEITPPCQGVHYFDGVTEVNDVSKEAKVRAVIEGQFLAKFNHTQKLGYNIGPTSRILATGGASTNQHILQVCAMYSIACVASKIIAIRCIIFM